MDNHLSEILGEKKLKVDYMGKNYAIRTMDSLSPMEFGRVMANGKKFASLTDAEKDINNAQTVMKMVDEVLEIIGPELPRYHPTLKERVTAIFGRQYLRKFPFSLDECLSIMTFWIANNSKKAVRAVMAPRPKRKKKK